MKLKPFKLKCRCPKCGGSNVKSRYEGPIDQDPCWYDRKYNPVGKWPDYEYMHRTCETCSYAWPEACLTKTKTKAA